MLDLIKYIVEQFAEDKENIDGLLKALQKAALDRHWDVFAKKATSLNDVLEITKSRFSEFGADMIDSITPLIVGGFNTLIDTIEGVQKAFNGLSNEVRDYLNIENGNDIKAIIDLIKDEVLNFKKIYRLEKRKQV